MVLPAERRVDVRGVPARLRHHARLAGLLALQRGGRGGLRVNRFVGYQKGSFVIMMLQDVLDVLRLDHLGVGHPDHQVVAHLDHHQDVEVRLQVA